jgi:2-oxoglutarate dehydrogenase E2 component (dihydrolipoamide succinyltransferase)
MLVEVKVPALSESVSEATLLTWHRQVGERVERDENLIDVETDKVVMELPAPVAGVLVEVIKANGGMVVSDEVIARIDTEAVATRGAAAMSSDAPAGSKAPPASVPATASAPAASSAVAMPAARKAMAEAGIHPDDVAGSGRGGRITKPDVAAQVAGSSAQPVANATAHASAATHTKTLSPTPMPAQVSSLQRAMASRPEERVPMSRLRQRVAERLVESQSTAAILTTFNEVNMQPVMDLRNRYKDAFEKEHGVKLGFMSFFVRAAVHALKKYPVVNASIDGNDIVYHGYFDIGIAVGSPRGLVVPILRDADQMSIAQIEKAIADFGQRAQNGKLGIEELTGGTFSISNGGVFGSMLSTPIINPPQSAILGVHATKERPVVEKGQIVIRPMNYLAMSYDHRIIDGREAVLTLVAIKDALEDPARLLLDL